ncbi:alpha/beta hydrolase [Litchfieldella qijiaojingensis]|uniref:Alpha/beta hydrolase n=1 Tax=Litchfieldella qijiaojingensis TaxID=980347 RepID=A0ABQ2YQM7_9GAMM|nr:alpha/beta hydrolase [Halomonas qijiaojingensis]GGX89421.1 alpha/beta hydrolase [Halomonas qijiaojingensis]
MLRLPWLAVAYALVVALVWAFQDRLLYLPYAREHIATPADRGMAWESVRLKTSDGLTLDAWWVPAENTRGSLLFFHGNAGNISHRLASIEQFHRLGLSVLIVDYRGYGKSEGSPSETGTALDARAAWRWLSEERGIAAGEIVLFGRSLGAAVAAELGREVTPAALVLESPFRSVPELAQRLYPFLPARWLACFDYDIASYVTEIVVPVLVIHSREDDIIPFSEGEAVFEAAREPKEMLVIGGSHDTGFLESEPLYLEGIDAFLTDVAGLPRESQ